MHKAAPFVHYPFGPSRRVGLALLAVAALGFACIVAWRLHSSDGRAWAGLALWCVCAAAAWSLWRGMRAGQLAWDGLEWSVYLDDTSRDGLAAQWPQVHLDLQSALLASLRLAQGRRVIWLWLERGSRPDRWDALRRAVYSRAPAAAAQARETQAGT
jgi:hypothetical protein